MTTSAVGPISRAPFTDLLVATLRGSGLLVGDHVLPRGGGWQSKSAGAAGAVYQPFVVVSSIVASHSSGPFADDQADWQLPYLLECFGGSRTAADSLGDRARLACHAMLEASIEVDLGDGSSMTYGFQQIRADSVGPPESIQQFQPPVWRGQSSVTLWAGKEI